VVETTAILTFSLTVAVHRVKKPFIYAGFFSLTTDGHRSFAGAPGAKERLEVGTEFFSRCYFVLFCVIYRYLVLFSVPLSLFQPEVDFEPANPTPAPGDVKLERGGGGYGHSANPASAGLDLAATA